MEATGTLIRVWLLISSLAPAGFAHSIAFMIACCSIERFKLVKLDAWPSE